jgi:hypothetical protein
MGIVTEITFEVSEQVLLQMVEQKAEQEQKDLDEALSFIVPAYIA